MDKIIDRQINTWIDNKYKSIYLKRTNLTPKKLKRANV